MNKQFLCFRLGQEHYLADITTVQEIIPYQEPNPVPGADAANLGMLDIRGNIISVFSGHALLGLNQTAAEADKKIIILKYANTEFGIVVDDMDEIISLDPTRTEHPTEGSNQSLITGTITHNGRLLIVLDLANCDAINLD